MATGKSLRRTENGGMYLIGSIDQKMGVNIGSIAVWSRNFRAQNPRRFAETLSTTGSGSLCPLHFILVAEDPRISGRVCVFAPFRGMVRRLEMTPHRATCATECKMWATVKSCPPPDNFAIERTPTTGCGKRENVISTRPRIH